MKHEVHYRDISKEGRTSVQETAFEIMPPLDQVAIQGLTTVLVRDMTGRYALSAQAIRVTRNDADGTALIVTHQSAWTSGPHPSSEQMAHIVANTIDPTGIQNTEVIGHDSVTGTSN